MPAGQAPSPGIWGRFSSSQLPQYNPPKADRHADHGNRPTGGQFPPLPPRHVGRNGGGQRLIGQGCGRKPQTMTNRRHRGSVVTRVRRRPTMDLQAKLREAMKSRDDLARDLLRVILGEVSTRRARTGKEPTEEEVQAIIRKVIAGNDETCGELE